MQEILIIPNQNKPQAMELCVDLVDILQNRDFHVYLEQAVAAKIGMPDLSRSDSNLWDNIDLVFVLGGDGTMLEVARRVFPREIPLLGVNLGHLGFLTRVESNRLEDAVELLHRDEFEIENRTMLKAHVIHENQIVASLEALNEMVVTRNNQTKAIRLETWIDGEFFASFTSDGMIVATATGSTAYSLSAGGPILDPRTRTMLLTPICAHSLYARPLVVNEDANIKIVPDISKGEVVLTADGNTGYLLQEGDEIKFRKEEKVTKLLRLKGQDLFKTLQSRLGEGKI